MPRANKGMRAFNSQKRRAMRIRLIAKYGPNCQICSGLIDLNSHNEDKSFSFDHIVALADGGVNEESNMWPAHIACNEAKGSKAYGGGVRKNRKPRPRRTKNAVAYSSSSDGFWLGVARTPHTMLD